MSEQRIVVTGLGVVSCFGSDVEEFHKALYAGKSGVDTIHDFDTEGFPTNFAGEIRDFDVDGYMDRKAARRADKYIRYTMVAGKKAVEESGGIEAIRKAIPEERCGVIIGSGMGGMSTFQEGVEAFLQKGYRKLSPFFVPNIITNMGGATLAKDYDFMGPNYAITTACATGSHCIIAAANHIRRGDADMMVAGGVEAGLNPAGLVGFIACRALSRRCDDPQAASRPWDKGRDGFVMGEGAGVVVLMTEEKAKEIGAPIIAEYVGGGVNCDAYHMTEPRPDGKGIASCIRMALNDGNVKAEDVNYINAHATSTPAGDMAEINAIRQVIEKPEEVTINATKSMIGHGLGAAAALEAVAMLMAIKKGGEIHPTINLDDPEPGILDFDVPTEGVKRDIKLAMSTSFGFGGHNAVLLFRPAR